MADWVGPTPGGAVKPFTKRCVLLAQRNPRRTVTVWLALMICCFLVGNALGMARATNADYGTGEAGRADAVLAASGLEQRATEYVLVAPRDDNQGAAMAVASSIRDALADDAGVASLGEPTASDPTSAVAIPVEVTGDPLTAGQRLREVRATVATAQQQNAEVTVELAGRATRSAGLDQQRSMDLVITESITIPIAYLILMIALRSATQALIPVVGAAVTVVGGLGLSLVGSHLTPDVGVGANVVVLLGLAVAIDYALFFIRERRYAGSDPQVRLERATHAGMTVIRAGTAIVAAALCLYLAQDVVLSSLATNTIAVVIAAVITSLLGVPALLVLQERVMARRNRPAHRGGTTVPPSTDAPLPLAVREPQRVLVITLIALAIVSVVMAVPLTAMSAAMAGVPGLLITWLGIVLVNFAMALRRPPSP